MRVFTFDIWRFKDIENETPNIVVSGTSDDDYISNQDASGATIKAGAGDDSIHNSSSDNVLIDGGADDDEISNYSSNVTMKGGAGKDYIESSSDSVTVDGGAGKDDIYIRDGSAVSVYGGDDKDDITNYASNSTLNGGAGDDKIYLGLNDNVNNVLVYKSGDGNDTITGYNPSDKISITGGTVTNWSVSADNSLVLKIGKGSITLVDVQSAKVNDSIINPMSTEGTWQSDTITNFKSKVTINGYGGWDEISNAGSKVLINTGDYTYKYVYNYGSNTTINGGEGSDHIYNYVSKVTINSAANDDRVTNYASGVVINGGAGDDRIYAGYFSNNENVTIDAGEGNDDIRNYYGSKFSINGGAGDDTIDNTESDNSTLDGGAGNDYINNDSDNVTIAGGKGNDSIELSSYYSSYSNSYSGADNNVILYAKGDGNDTVEGFDTNDTLSISGGSFSTAKSGDNIIVTVGDGKITLVGAASLSAVNIVAAKKATVASTLLTVTDKTKSPVTGGSAIKVINAAKRTTDVKITGNASANSISGGSAKDSIYGGKGNDTLLGNKGNDKLYGEAGNDILRGGDGADTLNGGAGNDTLTGGNGKDVFIYNGGNDVITDYAAEDKISITSGTAKFSASGNNIIFTVGSNKLTVTGGKNKTITYVDKSGEHVYPEPPTSDVTIKGKTVTLSEDYLEDSFNVDNYGKALQTIDASAVQFGLKITGNKLMNKIIGTPDDDTIDGGGAKDTILGGDGNDSIKGGAGNDSLIGGNGSDVFVYASGDGNDVIADYSESDKIKITKGTPKLSTKGKDVLVKVGDGTITLKGAADKIVTYIDKDGKEHTYGDTISAVTVNGKTVTISENYTASSFDLTGYAKTIKTINAKAVSRDLKITANDNANSVLGGAGNDTLIGGKGNDSLNGGAGADIFVWNSGDGSDVILNYAEEDKIKITSGTVKASTSGKNVILTVGSNKITVKGAADKIVTYINKNGTEIGYSNTVAIKGKLATLNDKYSKKSFVAGDYSSAIRTINASKVSKSLSITGSAFNDSITGGAGNDTLIGGHGNDTLKGGSGKDVFVYKSGDGNDTILNYAEEDKINIASGTLSDSVGYSGNDVVFSINKSGTITVKNGKGKRITLIDKNGNESGKVYGSSKLWFTADDTNFDTDAQLGSIVKSSAAAYSFADDKVFSSASSLPAVSYSSEK